MMSEARTLVMIPTYNESENVEVIASGVLSTGLDVELLFVDDGSPDGTGVILDRLARECPRLQVLHRPGKLGIGSAHKAGIRWAYQHGYTRLLTMDSDLSSLPTFLGYWPRATTSTSWWDRGSSRQTASKDGPGLES